MKTDIHTFKPADLIAELAKVAPSIAIETIWERDTHARWDADDSLDPDDFTAWQSEVKVSAIIGGKMVSGSEYLGGTWEKYGDKPGESNPEISGYLPQMIQEALNDLLKQLPENGETATNALRFQIGAALKII